MCFAEYDLKNNFLCCVMTAKDSKEIVYHVIHQMMNIKYLLTVEFQKLVCNFEKLFCMLSALILDSCWVRLSHAV